MSRMGLAFSRNNKLLESNKVTYQYFPIHNMLAAANLNAPHEFEAITHCKCGLIDVALTFLDDDQVTSKIAVKNGTIVFMNWVPKKKTGRGLGEALCQNFILKPSKKDLMAF